MTNLFSEFHQYIRLKDYFFGEAEIKNWDEEAYNRQDYYRKREEYKPNQNKQEKEYFMTTALFLLNIFIFFSIDIFLR